MASRFFSGTSLALRGLFLGQAGKILNVKACGACPKQPRTNKYQRWYCNLKAIEIAIGGWILGQVHK